MKTQEKNKVNIPEDALLAAPKGMPAIMRKSLFKIPLHKSFFISSLGHITGVLLLLLAVFCFNFFNIRIKIFPEQKQPTKDIEFIIKHKQTHKIKHPTIKPEQKVIKSKKTTKAALKKATTKKTAAKVQNTASKKAAQNPPKNQANKAKTTMKTQPSAVIPEFSMPMPNLKSMPSGLNTSTKTKSHAAGFEASKSSINDADSASTSGKGSSNHSGFDKTTTKKIITTYDISPYVNELKRNIKWNWKAPKENKRVELFLRIAKDGRLVILNVKKTSEVGEVDNAALNAVKKCLPLNPLPSKYKRSYLDIVFTFDSNSLSSRY